MFNNLFHSDLDLYVRQFQVSDPLFKRELRLTFKVREPSTGQNRGPPAPI